MVAYVLSQFPQCYFCQRGDGPDEGVLFAGRGKRGNGEPQLLEKYHTGEVHQDKHHCKRSINQRAVDQHFNIPQPVAQHRDTHFEGEHQQHERQQRLAD